jgi:hypothetical protein
MIEDRPKDFSSFSEQDWFKSAAGRATLIQESLRPRWQLWRVFIRRLRAMGIRDRLIASRGRENDGHILYLLERHTLQTGIHVQRIRVGVRRFGRFGVLRSPSQERDHHCGNDKSEPDPKILSHG